MKKKCQLAGFSKQHHACCGFFFNVGYIKNLACTVHRRRLKAITALELANMSTELVERSLKEFYYTFNIQNKYRLTKRNPLLTNKVLCVVVQK